MDAVNATQARKTFYNLIRRAVKGHQPVTIRHKDGDVVMISEEDYEGLLETLELLSTKGFIRGLEAAEADVAAGRVKTLEQALGNG